MKPILFLFAFLITAVTTVADTLKREDFNLLAAASKPKDKQKVKVEPAGSTYEQLREKAIKTNAFLIVFVNCPERKFEWSLSCKLDRFEEAAESCLIVGVPIKGELYRTDLSPTATESEIKEAIRQVYIASEPTIIIQPRPIPVQERRRPIFPIFQPRNSGRDCVE